MTLIRPDYVENDKIGRMVGLYCKVCGQKIGEDRRGAFYRFPNYAELKMKFLDGAMHVTNLCHDCTPKVADSRELMFECYQADVDDMSRGQPFMATYRFKVAPVFVTASLDRNGLL